MNAAHEELKFEVWDEDKVEENKLFGTPELRGDCFKSDDLIGRVTIKGSDLCCKDNMEVNDVWLDMFDDEKKVTGKLHL